jgi:hypothetical protein
MMKSSPWPKMLAPLGIALAVALLAAAGAVWWSGSGTTTVSDGGLGELIATTQAARAESTAAVQGDAASFDALSAREQAALRYTRAAMTDSNRVPEALFAELHGLFSDAELVELTFLVGFINMLNMFNNLLQVTYHGEYDGAADLHRMP